MEIQHLAAFPRLNPNPVLELSAAAEIIYVVRSRMRRQPLSPSTFDLRNFCESLLADYEPCGRLQFHRGEGPFPLVADAPRLRHALENLLSNALKYSDGPVVVSLAGAAQGYRIEVSDRGIGIPAEDQARIFDLFFRASNTGTKPGHGLGLCVVQSCIEEQGGRISFVSEPNQGTTFSIDLPSSPPGRAATQGEAVPAPIPAGKLPEPPEPQPLAGSFLVKSSTEKRLVKISEIKSILAYGEYSWVYWDTGKKGALLRKPLKQWQSELPGGQFIRVHRRAIVNLAFMDRVERLPSGRLQVHLRDIAEPILVSLSQTPVLNRKLKALRG